MSRAQAHINNSDSLDLILTITIPIDIIFCVIKDCTNFLIVKNHIT